MSGESGEVAGAERNPLVAGRAAQNILLALTVDHPGGAVPASDGVRLDAGDEVCWLVFTERADDAHAWLRERGWSDVSDTVSVTEATDEETTTYT